LQLAAAVGKRAKPVRLRPQRRLRVSGVSIFDFFIAIFLFNKYA
jgi:hypothetical protein